MKALAYINPRGRRWGIIGLGLAWAPHNELEASLSYKARPLSQKYLKLGCSGFGDMTQY